MDNFNKEHEQQKSDDKTFAIYVVKFSLPILLQFYKNAKSMKFEEYSKWVKERWVNET